MPPPTRTRLPSRHRKATPRLALLARHGGHPRGVLHRRRLRTLPRLSHPNLLRLPSSAPRCKKASRHAGPVRAGPISHVRSLEDVLRQGVLRPVARLRLVRRRDREGPILREVRASAPTVKAGSAKARLAVRGSAAAQEVRAVSIALGLLAEG